MNILGLMESTYTTTDNTTTYTIANAAGCDSIITLDLVIVNSYR